MAACRGEEKTLPWPRSRGSPSLLAEWENGRRKLESPVLAQLQSGGWSPVFRVWRSKAAQVKYFILKYFPLLAAKSPN